MQHFHDWLQFLPPFPPSMIFVSLYRIFRFKRQILESIFSNTQIHLDVQQCQLFPSCLNHWLTCLHGRARIFTYSQFFVFCSFQWHLCSGKVQSKFWQQQDNVNTRLKISPIIKQCGISWFGKLVLFLPVYWNGVSNWIFRKIRTGTLARVHTREF